MPKKFADNPMCELCKTRQRLKQHNRCEICDPLCRDCGERNRMKRNYTCGPCKNERLKNRYANDLEYKMASNSRMYAWKSKNLKELRAAVNEMYGGKCACCGEDELLFLAVDHVNNDGAAERKASNRNFSTTTFLRDLIRFGEPQSKYQLLCMNCNWGKYRNGICPHQVLAGGIEPPLGPSPVPESTCDS